MAKTKKKHTSVVDPLQCKGCQRCVNACPKNVLEMVETLNSMGYPYATYIGEGCIGCGACFYTCPEPGAITIYVEDE
jgi:NAD-dependent dihydropyrimidine dehydrogenase PreA subunit